MKQYLVILFVGLSFLVIPSENSNAAEVMYKGRWIDKNAILISGTIQKGDLKKIQNEAARIATIIGSKNLDLAFFLNTPGGDTLEAIKIGKFARDLLAGVYVWGNRIVDKGGYKYSDDFPPHVYLQMNQDIEPEHLVKAYSAGILIFFGGVERGIADNVDIRSPQKVHIPVVGIHRPYFDKQYFSKLSPSDAENQYRVLEKSVRAYLSEMGAPQSLIDRMFNSSSSDIELIPDKEFMKMFRPKESFIDEWLIAKCGNTDAVNVLNRKELKDYMAIPAKRMWELFDSLYGKTSEADEKNSDRDEYEQYLFKKAHEHFLSVKKCNSSAISSHQYQMLIKYSASRK